MSMREELKRIKNEKEDEKKQLAKVLEKKQHAVAKFNPMVRRLLDELGLATWGKGILRRKYQVGQLSEDTTVWIVRSISVYYVGGRICQAFLVKLCFDIEGNPSHFLVASGHRHLEELIRCQGEDFGAKIGLSESELETALVSCFKYGPTSWYGDDTSLRLIQIL